LQGELKLSSYKCSSLTVNYNDKCSQIRAFEFHLLQRMDVSVLLVKVTCSNLFSCSFILGCSGTKYRGEYLDRSQKEVTGGWRKPHKEERQNLCCRWSFHGSGPLACSPYIIRM